MKELPDIKPAERFNATEAARLLGISRETFRQHVLKGHIRPRYGRYSKRPFYYGKDILIFWRNL